MVEEDASTDVDLVARYRGGDAAAFDELFRRYNTRLRALCQRSVGDAGSADDMVQETFFRVIRSLDTFEGEQNFSAWIHRIAANVCIDELRRRQRRLKKLDVAQGDEADDLILAIPDPDKSGDPEAALETERLRHLVWEVAKRLPERQRMVLSLRELEGMSYASIANVLHISESAVVAVLHRARVRFRQEFLALEGPREEEGACAVVARLLGAVQWKELKAPQRASIEEHVAACAWCAGQYSEVVDTGRLVPK